MFISLLSFHLPFSLFILFYAALFPVVYLICFSKQNRRNCILFLRTFAYLFTFSFHVIINFIAFRLLSLSIPLLFFFFSSSFWSLIASKRYETGTTDLFFILFHNILSCRSITYLICFPLVHVENLPFSQWHKLSVFKICISIVVLIVLSVSIMKIKIYWCDDRPTA